MARAVGSSDTSVFSRNAQWLEDDIDKVFEHQNRRFRSDLLLLRDIGSASQMARIPNAPDCVCQIHILDLCARCSTIDSIAVYRDRKWREPKDGNLVFPVEVVIQ